MTEARFEYNGEQYTILVSDLTSTKRIHLAAKAPADFTAVADECEGPVPVNSLSTDTMDYIVDVLEETTDFDREQIEQRDAEFVLKAGGAVLRSIFENDDTDRQSSRCLKRVRCSEEFVECLFTEKMAIVAGMPNDATLYNFNYDPSRNELQFIFESDEWESVAEGEKIPCHEAHGVGFGDSTREAETMDLSE